MNVLTKGKDAFSVVGFLRTSVEYVEERYREGCCSLFISRFKELPDVGSCIFRVCTTVSSESSNSGKMCNSPTGWFSLKFATGY